MTWGTEDSGLQCCYAG